MFRSYRLVSYLLLVLYVAFVIMTIVAAFTAQPTLLLLGLGAGMFASMTILLWWLDRYQKAVSKKLAEDLREILKQLEEDEKKNKSGNGQTT